MGSHTEATLASATAIDLFRNGDLPNHGSDGKLWLQYWMFYYYNALNVETIGLHEGDFEMIQVALDAAGQPSEAVYAQHNGGERCPWSGVEHAGGIPVVYVAKHSHASYYTPNRVHHILDRADGQGGGLFAPDLESIASNAPRWVAWPGQWGADGPVGPRFNSDGLKWNNPTGWADSESVSGCSG